ncbi:hypothetical protein P9700_002881, partial [Enterococcus faecalis]|nr:hypothetical protein [Enterococcus faecalis]
MAYSKWVDNTDNSLESLIDKFLINREGTLDPFSNETLLHKVDLAFDDNQTFKIDEKVVT